MLEEEEALHRHRTTFDESFGRGPTQSRKKNPSRLAAMADVRLDPKIAQE
jgi:hypothetical protein